MYLQYIASIVILKLLEYYKHVIEGHEKKPLHETKPEKENFKIFESARFRPTCRKKTLKDKTKIEKS